MGKRLWTNIVERISRILLPCPSGAWRPGRSMQRTFNSIQRASLLAMCLTLAVALLAPSTAGAQGTTAAAAIKQCRHRYAGKGKKKRQAERRCIKKARERQQAKAVSTPEVPAPAVPSSVAPATPAGPAQLSPPDPGGETPPGPPAPSVPEAPAPLELEMSATQVVVGSASYRYPPWQLASIDAIESTAGAEPGVTVAVDGEQLVFMASEEAVPALLQLVLTGTGCTESGCGRQFVIRLRLTVEPAVVPLVEVEPNGPTSGPAGFGPQVLTPSCSYLQYGFENGATRFGVSVLSPREAFNTHTPPTLPVGAHRMLFECLAVRNGPKVWRSEGFEITVTGPSIPVGMESIAAPAGGAFVFTTGPSLGGTPCPTLPGVTADELLLNLNDSTGGLVTHRNISMPDGLTTESLVVPLGTAAGSYSVLDRCIYSNGLGESAFFDFGHAAVAVTG
jgi:hypothetical protein